MTQNLFVCFELRSFIGLNRSYSVKSKSKSGGEFCVEIDTLECNAIVKSRTPDYNTLHVVLIRVISNWQRVLYARFPQFIIMGCGRCRLQLKTKSHSNISTHTFIKTHTRNCVTNPHFRFLVEVFYSNIAQNVTHEFFAPCIVR